MVLRSSSESSPLEVHFMQVDPRQVGLDLGCWLFGLRQVIALSSSPEELSLP